VATSWCSTGATTAYDAADRPTVGTNPTAAYASDADGQLTARPGQSLTHDHLGRLTAVRDASGTTTIAAYTYDPLDRLRTADYGGGNRIRFRYLGMTSSDHAFVAPPSNVHVPGTPRNASTMSRRRRSPMGVVFVRRRGHEGLDHLAERRYPPR
jgi:YD repeat-containing protein